MGRGIKKKGGGATSRLLCSCDRKGSKIQAPPLLQQAKSNLKRLFFVQGTNFSISFIKFLKFYSLKAVVARARDKSRHENLASLQTQLKFSGRKLFAHKI